MENVETEDEPEDEPNLARPNLARRCRYCHRLSLAMLTNIYRVYLARPKHFYSICLDMPNLSS